MAAVQFKFILKTQQISHCPLGPQEQFTAKHCEGVKVCQGAWSAARTHSSHPSCANDGTGTHNLFACLFKKCTYEGYLRTTAKAESVGQLTRKDVPDSLGFPASIN